LRVLDGDAMAGLLRMAATLSSSVLVQGQAEAIDGDAVRSGNLRQRRPIKPCDRNAALPAGAVVKLTPAPLKERAFQMTASTPISLSP